MLNIMILFSDILFTTPLRIVIFHIKRIGRRFKIQTVLARSHVGRVPEGLKCECIFQNNTTEKILRRHIEKGKRKWSGAETRACAINRSKTCGDLSVTISNFYTLLTSNEQRS